MLCICTLQYVHSYVRCMAYHNDAQANIFGLGLGEMIYPLVMTHIAMENPYKWWFIEIVKHDQLIYLFGCLNDFYAAF